MCGIAGYAGWRRSPAEMEAELRAMCGAIRHRGPDDEGHLVAPGVALGMRRLSVIDIAGGAQPIGNEDGSVQVVFNGEIYNFHELHARLVAAGHRFETHSDTETLVHLYEERGERMVEELRGMFAFAIWDARRRRLFIARDQLGIKPLHYWEADGGIAFASELRSLLALDHFPRELSREAMVEYLALGYVPDPLCVFAGVRKLPPGHTLTWDADQGGPARVERYWSPVAEEARGLGEAEAVEELRRILDDAVRSHLEADVPLGAFLSGGIDSSTVVALMARATRQPVLTFSIGFDEPEFNEAPHAAAVAKAIGTKHTQLIVRPDVDALVEEVIRAFDEPFADSSALPTFLVSRLAREHVTVALSGDGGDELFGGYTRYAELLGRRELGPAPLRAALGGVGRRLPHGAFGRNRLIDLGRTRRGRYAATVAFPLATNEGGVLRPDLARLARPMDRLLERWFAEAAGRDFLTQMTFVDLMTYLPGDILTKVDRMSMATSLEARVPLLDRKVAEFAATLPAHLKQRDGTGKWILRRAIEGIVPREVLEKPKQGFAVPLVRWFRGPLRHRVDALLRPDSPIYDYADRSAVARVAAEHQAGRRDHSHQLWRLLALDLWLQCLARGELALPSAGGGPRMAELRRAV
ncbi:MAG: asparagine synthase (glutamine-hydrolyzing) [Gemmatimonadaceae bacterium]